MLSGRFSHSWMARKRWHTPNIPKFPHFTGSDVVINIFEFLRLLDELHFTENLSVYEIDFITGSQLQCSYRSGQMFNNFLGLLKREIHIPSYNFCSM